jgi:putative nucleotidyltransferase with HDIG domain
MAVVSPSRWIDLTTDSVPATGRVLLLSPNIQLATQMEERLRACNFTHLTTDSMDAAIAAVQADETIDVIVMDSPDSPLQLSFWVKRFSQMEAKNGSNDSCEPPALILLVEMDQVSEAVHAMEAGNAYHYLVRPAPEIQLMAAIQRAVEYRRLKQQNSRFRYHLESLISARTQMLQHAMQQLEQSYDITLEALGNALDLKDAETEGHSKRVTAYTLALGRAIGLNEQQLRTVGRGAFLHDVGKMAIPDAILRKPGKLTREEQAIMRTHSELGYRMIRKIPYLQEAAEIVYAHQEYYDGSGYPRGLRGEEIPIGARIFALADTLDAITSNRPYRKAASISQARKEVLRCAGTQFDPAIVDVFVATPDSIWLDLREGIMRDGPEFSPFGYTFGEVK